MIFPRLIGTSANSILVVSFAALFVAAGKRYALHFQDSGMRRVLTGRALAQRGVPVSLPVPLSSELVFFEQRD